jgi:hypothetical protein
MINYCGTCGRKTSTPRYRHVPEMGGYEDTMCATCERELKASGIKVEIVK